MGSTTVWFGPLGPVRENGLILGFQFTVSSSPLFSAASKQLPKSLPLFPVDLDPNAMSSKDVLSVDNSTLKVRHNFAVYSVGLEFVS